MIHSNVAHSHDSNDSVKCFSATYAVPTGVLQCVAVCCSVLLCVAVCCSVLQCVAVCSHFHETCFIRM